MRKLRLLLLTGLLTILTVTQVLAYSNTSINKAMFTAEPPYEAADRPDICNKNPQYANTKYYRYEDLIHEFYRICYYWFYDHSAKVTTNRVKMQLRCGAYMYGYQNHHYDSGDKDCKHTLTIPNKYTYNCGRGHTFRYDKIDGACAVQWVDTAYDTNHGSRTYSYIDVSIAHNASGSWRVTRETTVVGG